MSTLFRFPRAVAHDPEVEAWFHGEPTRLLVRPWYKRLRACGPDVRELIHDGHPTLCLGEVAFAYVDAFRTHASVGLFRGAFLDDPARLMEGTGKRMRHVKLRWGAAIDAAALERLIDVACRDMRACIAAED